MTKKIFFDTDCLSSFLWVRKENIMLTLYKGLIVLPQQVYDELSRVPHFYRKIESLVRVNKIFIMDIEFGTYESDLFLNFIYPKSSVKPIGKGEAAALALAKANNGIVASNNLRDVIHT